MESIRKLRTGALALGALGVVGVGVYAAWQPKVKSPPDVVLVVLDTVRASSTHLCGHPDPTTPTLDGLRADGWVTTCAGITPGTWTVPSHASFFTGRSVLDLQDGDDVPDAQTLASQLSARGYQTVMVSANMVLKKPDVLTAGFERVVRASSFSELRGDALVAAVETELTALDPERPVFLFVNIIDAHSPYPAVPDAIEWIAPQGVVHHHMFDDDPDTPFNRFVGGRMPPARQARYRARLERGYTWAVHQADATLAGVLSALDGAGRLEGSRVVITSDHGEFVGEHGQVGHGDTLFEPGVRVPLLMKPAPGEPAPQLPEPVALQQVFDLTLDGQLPAVHARPVSVVHQRPSPRESWNGVALWPDAQRKLVWREGHEPVVIDLHADPDEVLPAPIDDPAWLGEISTLAEQHPRADTVSPTDPETVELLRAAGYVE